MASSSQSPSILKTFAQFEEWKNPSSDSASNVTRRNIVDVVDFDDPVVIPDVRNATSTSQIPFVHLIMLMAFSGYRPDRIPLKNGVYKGLAASILAVEHLNTRNSSLVKEIDDWYMQDCPLRFTLEAKDDALSEKDSVDHVISAIGRTENLPSAFIDASRSATSIPTSIITGLRGYPQISSFSTSTRLDDYNQFPLFGRTVPSDAGTTVPVILYLRYTLGIKHLAVLHVNDSYGNSYALGLQLAAAEVAPDMKIRSFDFPFSASDEVIAKTITLLKETQFRYMFGIIFGSVHYEPVLLEAYRQGIAGTGIHNWIFSDSVSISTFAGAFERGSPLHLVSKGTSRIGVVGGVKGIPTYDKFLQSMIDLKNDADMELIQSKHPTYPNEPDFVPLQIQDDPDFFSISSEAVVPFLFDATISAGLSACHAYAVTENKTEYFSGEAMFDSYKNLSFEGASGTNRYDAETGTRIAETARFTILNVVEDNDYVDSVDPPNTVRFKTVETDVFREGAWNDVFPYIFNDGTTNPAPDLPPVAIDNNHLGQYLRGLGYCLTAIVLIFSFWSMIWTYRNREARVVKASQPLFLGLISTGCGFLGLGILFLSFDDEVVSADTCTAFCITTPWLLSFGWILAFSAIFTKTNRVNKIFHNPRKFKRIKVTPWDVMKPFFILLSIASITLLVWTILDPPVWTRTVTQVDVFGRVVETKGVCNFDESAPYAAILIVVLLGTVARSLYEAYVGRNISTEFAESDYIFLVLCIVVLVSCMGIPIMFIARDEPQARFFTAVSIIFVVSMAILVFIFVPKMIAHRQHNKKKLLTASSGMDDTVIPERGTGSGTVNGTIHISGLEHPSNDTEAGFDYAYRQSIASNRSTNDEPESANGDEGIKILLHPKDVDGLQEEVRRLTRKNRSLAQSREVLETMVKQSSAKFAQSHEDFQRLLDTSTGVPSPANTQCPPLPETDECDNEGTHNVGTETASVTAMELSAVGLDLDAADDVGVNGVHP